MARSAPPKEYQDSIDHFMGVMLSVNDTQIDQNKTPEILNLLPDNRGALNKRHGYTNLFEKVSDEPSKSFMPYRKKTGASYLFSCDGDVYEITDLDTGTYSLLYSGVGSNQMRSFNFNDKIYMLDGFDYWVYDGTTFEKVTGKIPTVAIGSQPNGANKTPFESYNILSAGFKELFTGNGSDTTYVLIQDNLDADTVLVEVNGTALVEGTDFTVDRTAGEVDFSSGTSPYGPPDGSNPNNVEITAFKDDGNADKVSECTNAYVWGGSADGTRVWLTGNPNYAATDFRSSLQDPTYFPENGEDQVGASDIPIRGYSSLYDQMIVLKEKEIYARYYTTDTDGDPVFTTQKLSGGVGCIATDSIDILENFPTFLSHKGVYMLTSIDPQNEKNVMNVSDAIDKNQGTSGLKGLLDSDNLEDYVGIDFNNQYWLFNPLEGFCWVYDYRYVAQESTVYSDVVGQWFYLDNLYVTSAEVIDRTLYWADSRRGMVNRLFKTGEQFDFADNELTAGDTIRTPITSRWISKIFNFGSSTNVKMVKSIYFTQKPSTRASVDVYYRSNLNTTWKFLKTKLMYLFTYSLLTYSKFTYGAPTFPKMNGLKVKAKKIEYFQIKYENSNLYEDMGILNTTIAYQYQRKVKS